MLDFPHFGSIDLTLALSVDGMLCRVPSPGAVEKDGYALSTYAKTLLPFGGWTILHRLYMHTSNDWGIKPRTPCLTLAAGTT